MIKFYLSLIIVCYFLVPKANSQTITDVGGSICWETGRKLKLSDFQGKYNSLENDSSSFQAYSAVSMIEIKLIPITDVNGRDNFLVIASFNRAQSWMQSTNHKDLLLLLSHEQLHFDISELAARKIRALVTTAYKAKVDLFNARINKEIQVILDSKRAMNDLYDQETVHGILPAEQKKWEKLVQAELNKLSLYKYESSDCK